MLVSREARSLARPLYCGVQIQPPRCGGVCTFPPFSGETNSRGKEKRKFSAPFITSRYVRQRMPQEIFCSHLLAAELSVAGAAAVLSVLLPALFLPHLSP